MTHWSMRLLALSATLLLTGCLWGPGKFTSELALKTDGSFVLDYRGEIVLMLPSDEGKTAQWDHSMAICYADGRTELAISSVQMPSGTVTEADESETQEETRACTAAEIATLKSEYEKGAAENAAAERKRNEEMARALGLPGLDDESNRAFAVKLMKYEGWRSVTYRGNGVFDVDYRLEGRATQDFLFPALPDNEFVIPFIAIRRRSDGSVLVTAPALAGGPGPLGERAGAAAAAASQGAPASRAEGTFTIVTDGEILANNSEDGASPHPSGRQLRWSIGPASRKVPEALVRLQ